MFDYKTVTEITKSLPLARLERLWQMLCHIRDHRQHELSPRGRNNLYMWISDVYSYLLHRGSTLVQRIAV